MDRFRSGGAGSTAAVEAQFNAEIAATQNALRQRAVEGQKQRRMVRRQAQQHDKYEKEHKVAAWNVRKSGNSWYIQDKETRILRKEEMLGAVEGQYREPVRFAPRALQPRTPSSCLFCFLTAPCFSAPQIRTVHGCVTMENQLMHPDYKRVLPPPAGQTNWSNKDYTNPLKHPSEGRCETFSGSKGPGDLRVTTDLSKVLPREFLADHPAKLAALERRAQSVESGARGAKRAQFIARTRFFTAPDAYSIKDSGYCSQAFPQAHPPTAPWRQELEASLGPNPKWSVTNEHPRIFSGTGQSITSSAPYYSWRESDAAAGPRRALTDRARHSVYTADAAVEELANSKGMSRTERLSTTAKNTFRLSSRALTLSLPTEAVPSQFEMTHRARACVKDTSSDTKRFIRDELVDPLRDPSDLKFIGSRQACVVGRQNLPNSQMPKRPSTSPAPQQQSMMATP